MTISRDRPVILGEFNRERMDINGFKIEDSWRFLMDLDYAAFVEHDAKLYQINQPENWENIFFLPKESLPELVGMHHI